MQKKPVLKFNEMLQAGEKPIVENPNLPLMESVSDVVVKKPIIKGKHVLMPEKVSERSGNKTPGKKMDPFKKSRRTTSLPGTDQQKKRQIRKKDEDTSHLFIRFRLQNNKMTVIHSEKIKGGFELNPVLHPGGLAYEATIDENKISHGSIPDYGVQRSYPDPNGGLHHEGHHFSPLSHVDVPVRIPFSKVSSLNKLAKLNLDLYRVKSGTENIQVSKHSSLSAEPFNQNLRKVFSMKGIDLKKLNVETLNHLKSNFK